jgi:hypothetical protein
LGPVHVADEKTGGSFAATGEVVVLPLVMLLLLLPLDLHTIPLPAPSSPQLGHLLIFTRLNNRERK